MVDDAIIGSGASQKIKKYYYYYYYLTHEKSRKKTYKSINNS